MDKRTFQLLSALNMLNKKTPDSYLSYEIVWKATFNKPFDVTQYNGITKFLSDLGYLEGTGMGGGIRHHHIKISTAGQIVIQQTKGKVMKFVAIIFLIIFTICLWLFLPSNPIFNSIVSAITFFATLKGMFK